MSDRAAAALVSSVLEDVGVMQSSDISMVVDRSKIRRKRSKTRKGIVANAHSVNLRGLF